MSDSPTSLRRLFWRSAEHLWLAVGTVGLGFASGEPLGLLVGLVAYALGQVYLPDSNWFQGRVDRRARRIAEAEDAVKASEFAAQRTEMLRQLSSARRERYERLVEVCADISKASVGAGRADLGLSIDTRLRKLDELLWTYLRLLTIGQSLETYLETERRENLSAATASAETEVADLQRELTESAAPAVSSAATETRRKLLASRQDRLLALQQRLTRVVQAQANLELAQSEQERLVEQAKLIRADAVAKRNAESLGARIDLSIEHLAETNRWLSDLTEFADLTTAIPKIPAGSMINSGPPPLPQRSGRVRGSTVPPSSS